MPFQAMEPLAEMASSNVRAPGSPGLSAGPEKLVAEAGCGSGQGGGKQGVAENAHAGFPVIPTPFLSSAMYQLHSCHGSEETIGCQKAY